MPRFPPFGCPTAHLRDCRSGGGTQSTGRLTDQADRRNPRRRRKIGAGTGCAAAGPVRTIPGADPARRVWDPGCRPGAVWLMRLVPKWRKCHLRLPIAMGLLLSVLRQMFGHPRLAAPPKSAYSDGIPC